MCLLLFVKDGIPAKPGSFKIKPNFSNTNISYFLLHNIPKPIRTLSISNFFHLITCGEISSSLAYRTRGVKQAPLALVAVFLPPTIFYYEQVERHSISLNFWSCSFTIKKCLTSSSATLIKS